MSEPQYDIAPLIARVRSFAKQRGIKPSTASRLVFGDGSRLEGLEAGKSCTVETARAAWERLDLLENKENAA